MSPDGVLLPAHLAEELVDARPEIGAARMDADDGERPPAGILLEDLVSDARDGARHLLGRQDDDLVLRSGSGHKKRATGPVGVRQRCTPFPSLGTWLKDQSHGSSREWGAARARHVAAPRRPGETLRRRRQAQAREWTSARNASRPSLRRSTGMPEYDTRHVAVGLVGQGLPVVRACGERHARLLEDQPAEALVIVAPEEPRGPGDVADTGRTWCPGTGSGRRAWLLSTARPRRGARAAARDARPARCPRT